MKTLYNIKKLFLIFCIPFFTLVSAKQEETINQYSLTNRSVPACYADRIAFIKDENEKEFVVKRSPFSEQAIHETVCAHILKTRGINTNHVEIIPAHHSPVRKFDSYVTTIHDFVPGEPIDEIDDMQDFNIQDGLVSNSTLKSIIRYKCEGLVAANIYLDDNDSNQSNNLFDKETNTLYTIDKERAFFNLYKVPNTPDASLYKLPRYLLATRTHESLARVNRNELSSEEINALKAVNNKLKELMIEYPPALLQKKWLETAEKINYEYHPEKQKYMLKFFEYNFDENCKVTMQLNRLTKPSHKLSFNNVESILKGMVKGAQNFVPAMQS